MQHVIVVVKGVVNKNLLRGLDSKTHGHEIVVIIRLFCFLMIMRVFSTREAVKLLKKNSFVWKRLGFKSKPSRASIDRWKKNYWYLVEQLTDKLGKQYLQERSPEWTILDSTPIEDIKDKEGKYGHCSKGRFFGFKLHMSCDEKLVPLKAVFTKGNIHDSTQASNLLAPTPRVGGDSAYDFQELKDKAKQNKSKTYFVHNPRRLGKEKKKKTPKILRKVRVTVEQCNSFVKEQVMQKAWNKIKGYAAKATFVLTAVLVTQILALHNLRTWGYPSIRISEVRY